MTSPNQNQLKQPDSETDLPSTGLYFKSIDVEKREASFVASDETIDADGDIVEQSWDLDRYRKNPVILFAHDQRSLPIGQSTDIGVKDGSLLTAIKFASKEANPMAEMVWQSVKEGTLRALSVGFRPRDVRRELRNDKEVFILADNELREISVVPVPSNPNAVRMLKTKAARKGSLSSEPDEEEVASASRRHLTKENRPPLEKKMDIEEVQKTLEVEQAKSKALESRCADLEKRLNESATELKSMKLKEIEGQIDSLIGKKIAPTEKAGLLRLAELDRACFDGQMKAIGERPDMAIAKSNPLGADPTPPSLIELSGNDGRGFEALVARAS